MRKDLTAVGPVHAAYECDELTVYDAFPGGVFWLSMEPASTIESQITAYGIPAGHMPYRSCPDNDVAFPRDA